MTQPAPLLIVGVLAVFLLGLLFTALGTTCTRTKTPTSGLTELGNMIARGDPPDAIFARLDADPEALTQHTGFGWGLLHAAVYSGRDDLIPGLVARGLDPNQRVPRSPYSHTRPTPLIIAVTQRDPRSVQALLHAGADPNRPDATGTTALEHARETRDPRLIELLEALTPHRIAAHPNR